MIRETLFERMSKIARNGRPIGDALGEVDQLRRPLAVNRPSELPTPGALHRKEGRTMKKLLLPLALAATLILQGCAGMGRMLTAAGTPPQAPAGVSQISRTAIDFALNSFDAALYGLDFAMDAHMLTPGSDTARRIAAVGRRVVSFLGVADAAQRLGSSATYEEAFANARTALEEFRQLLPAHPTALTLGKRPPLTPQQRERILRRLETGLVVASR